MQEIEMMDRNSIMDDEVFEDLLEMDDGPDKTRLIIKLEEKAKLLGVKTEFKKLLKAFNDDFDRTRREMNSNTPIEIPRTMTDFKSSQYPDMLCGEWIATEDGIYSRNLTGVVCACMHPVLPIKRLKNLQTGEEFIVIAYKRNQHWTELTIKKEIVASASKIVQLANYGLSVTSENARPLVRYLSDVENLNEDDIDIIDSTNKLGWHRDRTTFVPYDSGIIFDSVSRFHQLYDSVMEHGEYDTWKTHILKIRSGDKIEPRIMLAASFSSVLIEGLGILPFFVDLWGETEGGKTVALMVAASVWGDPAEGRFIGDFKSTDVALEAKADMLNSLPVILDDTSKVSAKIADNFEGVVYDLCSGKGKSRSNKELGVQYENSWHNCFLCNGERPLSEYVNQGGAVNRILEIEGSTHLFDDPKETANILRSNYGYAGREFVEILQTLDDSEISNVFKEFYSDLNDDGKMQKQIAAVSAVLTADYLIDKYLFKDGRTIPLEVAKEILTDRDEVSDNERAYGFIMDKIAMNKQRFIGNEQSEYSKIEQWGIMEDENVIFFKTSFDSLCSQGGFSSKSFLKWAVQKGIVESDSKGKTTKQKKIDGHNQRCVFLRYERDFVPIGESGEELPFI